MKTMLRIITPVFLLTLFSCTKKSTEEPILPSDGKDSIQNGSLPCTASLNDFLSLQIFPADNAWNQDISSSAVDAASTQILAAYAGTGVKADFGSGLWEGSPIGIPFQVVCGSQPKVNVVFRANNYDGNYGDESDAGPYPIPLHAAIEGNGQGDAHVLVVDKTNDMLYELYNASVNGDHWEASSGAVFNLHSNVLRTEGWTSADAAGLPIFPGLVKYDEVEKGVISHAIRFTLASANIKPAYISPARHKVGSKGGAYALPFGAKIRLRSNYVTTGFPKNVQVILQAMKKYGLILADVGSNMYISGAPDERWNNDELQQLGKVKASDFEVVKSN